MSPAAWRLAGWLLLIMLLMTGSGAAATGRLFPTTRQAIRQAVGIRGDINIRNQKCEQLNRTSDIAEIRPAGMPLDAVPLPPLLDARLSGMATNAFTLSGLEEVDGCLYAQSWWCREV